MRFIKETGLFKLNRLKQMYKKGADSRQRQRAHSIILSMKGFSIDQISNIIDVDRDSVSKWFSSWEEGGIDALSDLPKSGRPPVLFNDLKKN
jgi:transposase